MSSSQSLRPSAVLGAKFDDKPLWNHVKVVTTVGGGWGNQTWNCNYCNKKVVGLYTKVKGHLMRLAHHNVEGCMAISDDILEAIKEHETAEARKAQQTLNVRRKADYVSIPEGSDLLQQKKRKGMASGKDALVSSFNVAERDVADKEAARMFYASGLPFNFARSPYFRKYSLTLANSRLAGYVPPSFNRLRTTLLAQEKEHINKLLQPIKETWKKKGVSVVSDGWSDRQLRPLINVMAASSGRAMFVKAIDASGNVKDVEYVASLFIQVIKDLGEANVVQIVTDNASNYKAAGLSGTKVTLLCIACMAHSLVSKYYCDAWLNDAGGNGVTWVAPHEDHEVSINRTLAFKLLSQPASSSCAERNWSTYSVIQSIKRNRLTTSRSEDLVFVHCNLRLLSRKSKEYTDGPTKFWDISGDQFDIEGQEVGELAQLSLDEPELKMMTFQDAEEGEGTDIGTG
ncbi:hypothetical protein Acr_17g0004230 [Actinidia rufa]|uniref:DUF659 domain-containing protein n=1 Tax=Actinidia rufa TaxID=165716 RepID=A0A7J0G246_9ERIC|nr:hypothetical protein Acr_17g0004230 [Actinidia rufa]